jgi:hypothetical protein
MKKSLILLVICASLPTNKEQSLARRNRNNHPNNNTTPIWNRRQMHMKFRPRHTNEEIKARLIFLVGMAISIAFLGTIFSLLYGLLFVTQPLEVSPNDSEAWAVLSPLTLTMSGVLAGLLASNGLKNATKEKDKSDE